MRNINSQFNEICEFVNSVPVGQTFTTQEYLNAVGHTENSTQWKRRNGNDYYICHQYKGYLRRGGFLKNIKRGLWEVKQHIPAWFDLGHLQYLLGYYRFDYKNHRNVLTYKGLTREDIRSKLNRIEGSTNQQQMATISKMPSPSNDTTGSSQKSVNNINEKIVTNSTYGYKTENHSIVKTAVIEKIEHKDSNFFNEPSLSTGNEKMDIAVNVGVLESAQAVLSQFTSNDTFMRARVYNVMAQLEHISKELQEKANLI
jgi:hypothetical protein